MAITRATVTMTMNSGVPKDNVVNVWHFQHPDPLDPTTAALLIASVGGFYTTIGGNWGPSVSRTSNAHMVQLAEVVPGAAGPPDDMISRVLFEAPFGTTSAAVGGPLPTECAIAMSFRGNLDGVPEEVGTTRPAARKRGRVFLGPWCTAACVAEASTSTPVVLSTLRDIILDAYLDLLIDAVNTGLADHVVYSPTSATAAVVQEVYIDNAFDTIRSRGSVATLRDTRTVGQ